MSTIYVAGYIPAETVIPAGVKRVHIISPPRDALVVRYEPHRDTSRWMTVPRIRQWGVFSGWHAIGHYATIERAVEVAKEHHEFTIRSRS